MFGMGFKELLMVALVLVLVTGPKELPKMLRSLGIWAGKARRFIFHLRVQSGIDRMLQNEELADTLKELQELRKLARGQVHDLRAGMDVSAHVKLLRTESHTLSKASSDENASLLTNTDMDTEGALSAQTYSTSPTKPSHSEVKSEFFLREYPLEGPDAYGSLPDSPYLDAFPTTDSMLSKHSLYMVGIEEKRQSDANANERDAP